MRRLPRLLYAIAVVSTIWPNNPPALAAARLAGPNLDLRFDDVGRPVSFLVCGQQVLGEVSGPAFALKVGGKWIPASSAKLGPKGLRVVFDKPSASFTLAPQQTSAGLIIQLADCTVPPQVEALRLLSVPVRLPRLGTRLGVAGNEPGPWVAIIALRLETHCTLLRSPVSFLAETWRKFGLASGRFALIPAPDRNAFLRNLRAIEKAAGLPDGVGMKLADANRPSYLFLGDVSEDNVDRAIRLAKLAGLGDIWLGNYNWASSIGHYPINRRYFPHGLDGLRRTVERIHAAGLRAGMHVWASKVSPNDPYVTPDPDSRLYKDRVATLAEDLNKVQRALRTKEDLRGWPGEQKIREGRSADVYRILQIGDEWIRYKRLLDDGRGVTGCQRGALGSRPANHKRGTKVFHVMVDPCIRGFVVDQDADIHDEMAQRIADVWNAVGFDCIYYDGVEDCQPPHWYYVPRFQLNLWRRFKRKPVVCQGTFWEHFSWHIHTRGGTIDYILEDQLAEVRDRALRSCLWQRENFMPGALGWFAWRIPTLDKPGTQFDAVEYLCAKAAGYDMAFSLLGTIERFEAHPYGEELLRVVGEWERLRLSHSIPVSLKKALQDPDKQFTLLSRSGRPQIVQVKPLRLDIGNDGTQTTHPQRSTLPLKDLRVYFLLASDTPRLCYWHTWGAHGELRLPIALLGRQAARKTAVTDWRGKPGKTRIDSSELVLPLGGRWFVSLPGARPPAVEAAFKQARIVITPGRLIVLRAVADAKRIHGPFRSGKSAGLSADGALSGDFLVYDGPIQGPGLPDAYAEYEVNLPEAGMWHVWGRMRFPVPGGFSFAFIPQGHQPSRSLRYVLGNSAQGGTQWHWDSASAGDAAPLGSQLSRWPFPAGKLRFRVYPREGPGSLKTNPQLDLILLVRNPAWKPKDAQLTKLLSR